MHRLSPTQLGRRPTGRQTLPALDAKCSFGHSKKRRRHLCVPLCRELLITKTQREMGPNLSPAHPNCHLHVQPRKQKARECRNDGGGGIRMIKHKSTERYSAASGGERNVSLRPVQGNVSEPSTFPNTRTWQAFLIHTWCRRIRKK